MQIKERLIAQWRTAAVVALVLLLAACEADPGGLARGGNGTNGSDRVPPARALSLSGAVLGVTATQVTVRVADAEFAAPVSADGRYRVAIAGTPHQVVRVYATAGEGVRLASLVGLFGELAAAADEHDLVDTGAVPALTLSPLTTAAYAVGRAAVGGRLDAPASLAPAEQAARLHGARVRRLTAAIVAVLEEPARLPEGVVDTLALLADDEVFRRFRADHAPRLERAEAELEADPEFRRRLLEGVLSAVPLLSTGGFRGDDMGAQPTTRNANVDITMRGFRPGGTLVTVHNTARDEAGHRLAPVREETQWALDERLRLTLAADSAEPDWQLLGTASGRLLIDVGGDAGARVAELWQAPPFSESELAGRTFRIGGTELRWELGEDGRGGIVGAEADDYEYGFIWALLGGALVLIWDDGAFTFLYRQWEATGRVLPVTGFHFAAQQAGEDELDVSRPMTRAIAYTLVDEAAVAPAEAAVRAVLTGSVLVDDAGLVESGALSVLQLDEGGVLRAFTERDGTVAEHEGAWSYSHPLLTLGAEGLSQQLSVLMLTDNGALLQRPDDPAAQAWVGRARASAEYHYQGYRFALIDGADIRYEYADDGSGWRLDAGEHGFAWGIAGNWLERRYGARLQRDVVLLPDAGRVQRTVTLTYELADEQAVLVGLEQRITLREPR